MALVTFNSTSDEENVAIASTNLSAIYMDLGLYQEALTSLLIAIKIIEKGGESLSLASCYNELGLILSKTKDYSESLSSYREAVKLFYKLDSSYLTRTYNNLGRLFIELNQYDSAKHNLQLAATIKRKLNDTQGLARTISIIGKVEILTRRFPEAEIHLVESISIQKQIDDPIGMMEVMNNLGELYLLTNRYKQAARLLHESEGIARNAGTPEYLRQNLELQVKLAREQHDFASGMKHLEELLTIRDSLLNEEKSKSMQAMRIRYETEKKEQQIALLEQREEVSRVTMRNNQILIAALIIGLFLVLTIGLLIYSNLRNAKAAKSRMELLLAETHHRIKNNLQMLASIFHLQTKHYTDQEMVLEAQTSESRVHAMSMLHERFSSTKANHTLSTKEYISDLVNKLVDLYSDRSRVIKVNAEVENIEIDIDKAFALSLIIQELICNAFKYAFDKKQDPELTVSLQSNDHEGTLIVKDNGIGLDEKRIGTSQGLSLVDALVSQLNGIKTVHSENGTIITIQFPLPQSWNQRLFS